MAATSPVLTCRSATTPVQDIRSSLAAIRIHDMAAAGLAAVLVLSVGLTDGGYYGHAYTALTVLLCAGSLLAVLGGVTRRPSRAAIATLAVLGFLTAWIGLSALWAVPGAGIELEARRSVLYLVALGSVLVTVDARRRRAFLAGLLAALTLLGVVAVAIRAASGAPADRFYGRLLEEPVGYPNALGVLVAIGCVLALGLGARRDDPAARPARATAPFLVFVLGLTGSRGAALACGVGIALLVVLATGTARRSIASGVVAALAIAGAAWAVVQWRGAEGAALAAVALATLVGGWALASRSWVLSRRRLAVIACILLGGSLVVVALRPPTSSSSYRVAYWRAAMDEAAEHPLLGTGAGSFSLSWGEHRTVDLGVRDAHSLYVETLSELGPVGLLLVVSLVAVPVGATVRRRGDPTSTLAGAAFAVFAVHAGLDWDWEMPVVTLTALGCAGVALTRSSTPPKEERT
jgi:O-antigen ligase/polysaccharide polymerase Wzy-like membrane protein